MATPVDFRLLMNTLHSWPSVIAILSWLTDIVLEVTREEEITDSLPDILVTCFIQRYDVWNMGREDTDEFEKPLQELEAKLVQYYGNDLNELQRLEEKNRALEANLDEYTQLTKKKEEEVTALREHYETLQNKCVSFSTATKQLEDQLRQNKDVIYKKIEKLNHELENLFVSVEDVKNRVKNQPYKLDQKNTLIKEIENLQNVVKLKEERCQLQKDHLHTYDHQLSDLMQKIQESAYKYNNIISEIELVDPVAKELHIRESGFARSDTEQQLKDIQELLTASISKTKNEVEVYQRQLQNMNEKDKMADDELFTVNRELEECLKTNAESEIMLKQRKSKLASEKQLALDKLSTLKNQLLELKSTRPDIASLELELQQINEACDIAKKSHMDLMFKALEFFTTVEKQIADNVLKYREIMNNISNHILRGQEKKLEDAKFAAHIVSEAMAAVEKLKQKINKN